MNLKTKILLAFLTTGLTPILVVAVIALQKGEASLMAQAYEQMEAVREIKSNQLQSFFQERTGDITVLSRSQDVVSAYRSLKAYHDEAGVLPHEPFPVNSQRYRDLLTSVQGFLTSYRDVYGYYDIYIICRAHGHVMYSAALEADLGANLSVGDLHDSGLGQLWQEVRETGELAYTDFSIYPPSFNEPAAFIGMPVVDNGQFIGIVALQISVEQINQVMQERAGMGNSGETYLVADEFRMRSDSYLDPSGHSVEASLNGTVAVNGVDTEASRRALRGIAGQDLVKDYNGHMVLSAYQPLDILGRTWAIIAEIDLREVREPVVALRNRIALVSVIIAAVVVAIAAWLATSISGPIVRIAALAQRVAQGDVDQQVEIRSSDEIGLLARAFGELVDNTSQMANSAQSIATGDLTRDITPRSEADVLGLSFVALTQRLRQVFTKLKEQAAALSGASDQMSAMASHVAKIGRASCRERV